ncbi:MAG: hypothetical protein ACJ762_03685 [Solirubrobacteraceae bacterium]
MGLGAARTLLAGDRQTLVLPADGGVVPTRVAGRVTRTDGTARAELALTAGGRTLGRVVLGAGQRSGTFDVALPAATRREPFVELGLVAASPDPARCDARSGVEITGAAVTFVRRARPRGIANALPGVLRRLRIVISGVPSAARATAAVRLAAALVARYPGQRIALDVLGDGQTPAADPDPFGATLVIAGGDDGLGLERLAGTPVVTISGSDATIEAQADRAIEQLRLFSRVEQAAGLPLAAPAELPATVKTLADLGARVLRARGLGELTLTVPFSQSDLGGPVRDVGLRVRGSISALAEEARASLAIALDDRELGSWPLRDAGPFEHVVDVPGGVLARDNALRVTATYTLPDGGCGAVPLTLTVDPQSTVTSDFGLGPVAGLGDVPQSLLPITGLALTRYDLASVGAAVRVGALLQRLTRRPLAFRTVSQDAALHGEEPAILVGPGAPMPALDAGPAASLQALRVGDRTLVSAGYRGTPALLTRMLDLLAARPTGLTSAGTSSAVVDTPDSGLRLIAARVAAPPAATEDDGGLPGALIAGAVLVLVLLAAGGAFAFHRRYW